MVSFLKGAYSPANIFNRNKSSSAFTLSETLIVLTVLGIIASITIPTMSNAARKHAFAVSVRKIHTTLSTTVSEYMIINGISDLRSSDMEQSDEEKAQEAVHDFIKKYFKVAKECHRGGDTKCFAERYKSLANASAPGDNLFQCNNCKAMVLADDSVLTIWSRGNKFPLSVVVDVNGKKGPNINGYDVWGMSIFYDGSVDDGGVTPEAIQAGEAHEIRKSHLEETCKIKTYGGCFGGLIENKWVIDW